MKTTTEYLAKIHTDIRANLEKKHHGSALSIAGAIWVLQDKFGYFEGDLNEIAEQSGRSRATVCAYLKHLEKIRVLSVVRSRYSRVRKYTVHVRRAEPQNQPQSRPAAPATLPTPQTPQDGAVASRRQAIEQEIKALQRDAEPGLNGLLIVRPEAKGKIAALREELRFLNLPTKKEKEINV